VGASVASSVGASVGASVASSVGASVGAGVGDGLQLTIRMPTTTTTASKVNQFRVFMFQFSS